MSNSHIPVPDSDRQDLRFGLGLPHKGSISSEKGSDAPRQAIVIVPPGSTRVCRICRSIVDLETCNTDERGNLVHGRCYAAKLARAKLARMALIDGGGKVEGLSNASLFRRMEGHRAIAIQQKARAGEMIEQARQMCDRAIEMREQPRNGFPSSATMGAWRPTGFLKK